MSATHELIKQLLIERDEARRELYDLRPRVKHWETRTSEICDEITTLKAAIISICEDLSRDPPAIKRARLRAENPFGVER